MSSDGLAIDPVIRIDGISKCFRIGGSGVRNLKETMAEGFSAFFRGRRHTPLSTEEFWALKDVSFEVGRGDTFGIIGRNGAGKSTLLKILSRIIDPTSGRATIDGRVASLLEVGTGFHPDLTGRENVFLNGAILGMKRADIRRRFDEIVDFADIGRFIDTPVKRYSSGMYVRLAFAVAAHLDPDILVIDEVLAVGDAAFQRKCLGKVGEVERQGSTILLVSHNLGAIRRMCRKAVWLKEGRVERVGDVTDVVDAYARDATDVGFSSTLSERIGLMPDDPVFRLLGLEVRQDGLPVGVVLNGSPTEIHIRFRVREGARGFRVFFDVLDEDGMILIRSFHDDDSDSVTSLNPGEYAAVATIPADLLAPRSYTLKVFGTIHNVRSIPPEGVSLLLPVESSNSMNRAYPSEPIRAKIQPRIAWRVQPQGGGP